MEGNSLGVPEAVYLDVIPLGKPAHSDVLVAVGGDDVFFVGGEEEGVQEGCVPEDEAAAGRVFVRRQRVALVLFPFLVFVGWRRGIVEWIAV